MVNTSCLCGKEEESTDHILIHVVWVSVCDIFYSPYLDYQVHWVLPSIMKRMLLNWCGFLCEKEKKEGATCCTSISFLDDVARKEKKSFWKQGKNMFIRLNWFFSCIFRLGPLFCRVPQLLQILWLKLWGSYCFGLGVSLFFGLASLGHCILCFVVCLVSSIYQYMFSYFSTKKKKFWHYHDINLYSSHQNLFLTSITKLRKSHLTDLFYSDRY